ncbi:MAG: site-specific integrase [Muribaculaceae bacterium]|nr:site-specific integrase [Muribaculaceae bacterium]
MFTYKFIVKENKGNSLRLRLTNNRKVAEISMGVQLSPEDLADAMSVKPKSNNIKWKSVISDYQAKLDDIKCELLKSGRADEDVKVIRDIVLKECFNREETEQEDKTGGQFVTHFQSFIEGKTNKGTRGVYKHTLDRIRLYDSKIEQKSFEEIDLKWLTGFEAFCAQTATKNARNIHLRNIRAVFNNAIDYEITTAYPFRRFKIRPEATRKRALSVEELRKLFAYPVETYAEIYRDMFKLMFMLIGINTVDIHRLKSITKEGRIEYKRAKTGRLYSIRVEPEALELIEKYKGDKGLLCIADRWSNSQNFRHQYNKALQRIGEMERKGRGGKKIIASEFPEITTYWARHSWATIAYSIGVSKDVIAQALGHSDGHDTTNIYINEDLSKIDEANRRVLDWVLHCKK